MKTLFTLAISCFLAVQSFGQIIKASVATGTAPNRLKILMMSDVDQLATDGPITSLTYNVAIDATGVPVAPVLNIIALPTFPGPATQWIVDPPFLEGGYWNYNIFLNVTTVRPISTANIPYEVIEVEFRGFPLLTSKAGLVSLINGGSNTQSYFYCNGPVYSDGLSQLYFPAPGVTLVNSDSYDATGFNGNGISSALLDNITLPVKFTGFTAIKKDNSALLSWQVESETALTDRYEVERSLNGIDFKIVSTIAPKNNGRSANSYTSTDENLSAIHSSVIYYRIKQTDKDGQFVYTDIKSVRLDNKAFSATVFPNPVRSKANVSIDLVDNAPLTLTLNDGNGKVIKNIQINGLKGINRKQIDMSGLSTGNYILRIQTPAETTTITIVKGN